MAKKQKKKGGFVNALLTMGILVCIGVFSYSGFRLYTIYQDYKVGENEYEDLQKYAVRPSAAEEESAGDMQSISAENEEADMAKVDYYPPDVDFVSLQKINPDIVGWLDVEALDISYPIVKGKNNDEYLHRTFEKKDNFAGSIFMDYMNGADFNDCNTIIYGHNMKNQSMFGRLKFIREKKKYQQSRYFWIITPEGKYHYEIFSAHVTRADGDTYTLFSAPGQQFLDYLNKMVSESQIPLDGIPLSMENKAVTLTTCTSDETERFVVQGVRVETW